MIGRLTGRLLEKQPPHLVLDVQGVGYELEASMNTLLGLPAVGEDCSCSPIWSCVKTPSCSMASARSRSVVCSGN
ncbi:OB-fold domain-containing protein [Cobetia marina]